MIILDSDIFSEVFNRNATYSARLETIPREQQHVTIVTCEEALQGWMSLIRQAEQKRAKTNLAHAYDLLLRSIEQLARMRILPYTAEAHEHYLRLKSQKIRIGTRDLRIASIALAHDATLITRNRRDYELVPNLELEVWN